MIDPAPTPEPVDWSKAPAGRELDAEVATRLMGFTRQKTPLNDEQDVLVPAGWTDLSPSRWWGHDIRELVPYYSTDIGAAWTVAERLMELGCNHFSLEWERTEDWRTRWQREQQPKELPWLYAMNAPRHLSSSHQSFGMPNPVVLHAETMPLAICRAALQAVSPPEAGEQ
jgi:hypothetical protein